MKKFGEYLTETLADEVKSEPTSAAAVAALKQYSGKIKTGEKVVVSLTGHGLKASSKIAFIL